MLVLEQNYLSRSSSPFGRIDVEICAFFNSIDCCESVSREFLRVNIFRMSLILPRLCRYLLVQFSAKEIVALLKILGRGKSTALNFIFFYCTICRDATVRV